MKTDTEIRSDGLRLLFQHLDSVDAERFLAMVNCERFDYTPVVWSIESVASLAAKARAEG